MASVQNKIQIHDAHSTRNKTEQSQTRGTKNNRPKKILTPEVSVAAAVASSAVAAVAAVAGAAAPPAESRSYIIGTCAIRTSAAKKTKNKNAYKQPKNRHEIFQQQRCAIRTSAAKKNKEQECIQTTKKST